MLQRLDRPASQLRFASASRSHAGLKRSANEDRVLDCADRGVWAVADGMGGHREGAVAAAGLIQALSSLAPTASGYARLAEATRRVERLNAELFELRSRAGPIGSTLVFLLAHEGHYACAWAGDSRAYLWRSGALVPITRDHSLVQELVETGVLNDDHRRTHPSAHIVTRAVGAQAELRLDQRFAPIEPGDVFLLCSDGLTGCLSDSRIAEMVNPCDLEASADRLLDAVLQEGAPDNVSLVLVGASA